MTANDIARVNAENFFAKKNRKLPKKYTTAFEIDGNYTIAVVSMAKKVFVGVSKRNPIDPVVPERGKTIALIRALTKAMWK